METTAVIGSALTVSVKGHKEERMTITLSDEEATILCGLIDDEQNCVGYEQYWTEDQRELFDEIVWKLKNGFGT